MKYIKTLSETTGITSDELISNYLTAPRKYKEFTIPKRSGGKRKIAQPTQQIKHIQKSIIDMISSSLMMHNAATAYRPERSIYHNALPHKNSTWILKLDFRDFFHSIRPEHVKKLLESSLKEITNIEIDIFSHYLFWLDRADNKLKLSIGAPSSPILSNAVMFEFDSLAYQICTENNIIYTRYADDLTFSGNSKDSILVAEEKIKLLIDNTQSPLLVLNEKKRVLIGGQKSKRVTGVIITHDKKLSIGRYKRKKIRAMLHLYTNKKLSKNDIPYLHGTLSHINSIEPEYYKKIQGQYGDDILKKLAKDSFNISLSNLKAKQVINGGA